MSYSQAMESVLSGPYQRLGLIAGMLTGAAASLAVFPAQGQCIGNELAKAIADDARANDQFGRSVAIEGDLMVVGAPRENHDGLSNAGAAYVFRLVNGVWTQEAKLVSSDPQASDHYGDSVDLSGDVIVVGAPLDNHNQTFDPGGAFVYRLVEDQWVEEQKLTADDFAEDDEFGNRVGIVGDAIVVSAPRDDHNGLTNAGSAYAFRYDGATWVQEAKLMADDAGAGDLFGNHLEFDFDAVVIGAWRHDSDRGAAYVFRDLGGTWVQETKFTASDAQTGDRFGVRVSTADGKIAAIGAWEEDEAGSNAGAVYVYRFDEEAEEWFEEGKLMASNASAGDKFGVGVACNGELVLAGSRWEDQFENNSGAVYVFRPDENSPTGWIETVKLKNSDVFHDDEFGFDIRMSEHRFVVGVPFDNHTQLADAGAAYVFSFGQVLPNHVVDLDEFEILSGTLLDGALKDLDTSDDQEVTVQSVPGFSAFEPHIVELAVFSENVFICPSALDMMIESRISDVTGTGTVRLRNWNTGQLDTIGTYDLGFEEAAVSFLDIDSTDYIGPDDTIEVQIKNVVIAPLQASGFNAFFDLVQTSVK